MSSLELKVPPLLLVLIWAAVMWLLSAGLPAADLPIQAGQSVALLLYALGFLFTVAGVMAFRRARTTMNPLSPEQASAVVDGGVYRLSRNPMYLGFLLALAGWAMWLGNGLCLVCLPLFVLYMNRFQILPEERAMRERFGESFEAYRQRVRRWL